MIIILLIVLALAAIWCINTVNGFKKKEIRRRMQSAPIPFVRQNLAGAAALLLVCTGIWLFYLLLQAVIYQGGIFRSGFGCF